MPYIRNDVDIYDEMVEELGEDVVGGERPSGEFEYETATATFKRADLESVSQIIFDALVSAGATKFRVTYDGGYDEGFSHSDTLFFGSGKSDDADPGEARGPTSVGKALGAHKSLVDSIRTAAGKSSMWGNAAEFYAKMNDAEVCTHAMDELAQELATKLLGEGFGTGEYQLYGALTADLRTGEIVDHEGVAKPGNME